MIAVELAGFIRQDPGAYLARSAALLPAGVLGLRERTAFPRGRPGTVAALPGEIPGTEARHRFAFSIQ